MGKVEQNESKILIFAVQIQLNDFWYTQKNYNVLWVKSLDGISNIHNKQMMA